MIKIEFMKNNNVSDVFERLAKRAESDLAKGIKTKFAKNVDRVREFSKQLESLYFDFSKSHIDAELLALYLEYAKSIECEKKRVEFLSGQRINKSENRSVLHTLLRDTNNQGIAMDDATVLEQAEQAQQQFSQQYETIQRDLSARDIPIKNIIHVGIGGSSLGTQLVYEALKELGEEREIHFIGNIDAHQLASVFDRCDVKSTLVIGVSKTFTTAETLQNLDSIVGWFNANGVDDALSNFYGVTANPEQALSYGLPQANIVSFPEWVGGRYSVWSSVSLSAALLLGKDKFDELLDGAAAMDRHFYSASLADNICFQAAALDHYYANFMGVGSKGIFAYDHRFRSLVSYLQQLETESNGKDRKADGSPVEQKTSMVVWGGVGTDVQHSVFQMLHQGTAIIPSEFILVKTPDHTMVEHHNELLANGVAQTAALLAGQDLAEVERLHSDEGLSELTKKAKVFSGDRPSITILLERLTPKALGALLAFYEHRVFFGGVLTEINSFDQMGVELGKRLAKQVRPLIDKAVDLSNTDFDASTEQLITKIIS